MNSATLSHSAFNGFVIWCREGVQRGLCLCESLFVYEKNHCIFKYLISNLYTFTILVSLNKILLLL